MEIRIDDEAFTEHNYASSVQSVISCTPIIKLTNVIILKALIIKSLVGVVTKYTCTSEIDATRYLCQLGRK